MKLKLIKGSIIIALICFTATGFSQNQKYKFPFQNPNLSFEQRVEDLVSRMTLEEKVAQMLNKAPAIERLDIPAYDWWNEVLHGVARSPYKVTVYPQAIAMAATWNTQALKTMADYSATEGRAIYEKTIEEGKAGQRYTGLTYWSPNVNIFRDPRWGRGQETYGEDPYLTAMLGKAFVQGLQGDDPKYLKSAACAKHYAVHSGPEKLRHVFDAVPSNYDLWNTYLPGFKELVVNANVVGVMCAYNAFEGQPCCGSDPLMVDILRNQWKFKGYVTSDCWAIDDFYKNHKTHPDAEHASADAVMHGTDVDCGTSAYMALVDAVKSNLISEKQIDVSVKRLFMVRFRLGMFDPASIVKYANTPMSVLESEPHKAQSLKMARESIVLLKNSNQVLPLKKNIHKIAVIGPNADNEFAVLGNYNGVPSQVETALQGIKNKVGKDVEVVYEQGVNFTNDTLFQREDIINLCSFEGKQGFKAEYFDNTKLSGAPILTRMEKQLDNFWQEGEQITSSLKAYNFSARYTTNYIANRTGEISFEIIADDGFQFFVDGERVLSAWANQAGKVKSTTIKIVEGTTYKLELKYIQKEGKASIKLNAGKFEKVNFVELANRLKDADAIVCVGGISPELEGEDMPVNFPGFDGGDRTSILLPTVQTELLKALNSTGKPLVFVMMTGSAIAIPWEAENVPAIINAWYGGQSAGTAIADVLFGDYNPAGRLPITFYKSDSDLPSFNDYSMDNRTYRYFKGEPLYPFGFGLSYTTFKYGKLQLPANVVVGKALSVSIKVTNSGKRDGDEVVQLYLTYPNSDIKTPIRALKGFHRISLKKGESKNVQFLLQPQDLSIANESGQAVQPLGNYVISVGGGQTGNVVKSTVNVMK